MQKIKTTKYTLTKAKYKTEKAAFAALLKGKAKNKDFRGQKSAHTKTLWVWYLT